MARLHTNGFEVGDLGSTNGAHRADGDTLNGGVVPTYEAVTPMSGGFSINCSGSNGVASHLRVLIIPSTGGTATTLDRVYYARLRIKFTVVPPGGSIIIKVQPSTDTNGTEAGQCGLKLRSDGKLALVDGAEAELAVGTTVLAVDTEYVVELRWKASATVGADECECRLDGVSEIATQTGSHGSITPFYLRIGYVDPLTGNSTLTIDDLAINDDQGADQNSWPDDAKIVLCKPISQGQRGSWTGGAGGTGDLTTAIDNTPPVGTASETDTSQMESADTSPDNATDEYRANLTTYTNAGIGASDTITVMQPVINHGEDVATGTKTGSLGMQANPAVAYSNFTFGDNVGALGVYPSNWRWSWGDAIYNPSVTKSSAPVLGLRKTDTGNRVASIDFAALYVEYQEPSGTSVSASDTGSGADIVALVTSLSATLEASSGVDVVTEAAIYATTESGSGAEAGAVTAPKSSVDSGAGVDVVAEVGSLPSADTGSGADAQVLAASQVTVETGSGVDTGAATVPVAGVDTGSGVEAVTEEAALPAVETGIGTDNSVLGAVGSAAETGMGTDAPSLAAVYGTTDAFVGTETILTLVAGLTGSDVGIGVDDAQIVAALATLDAASGVETTILAVILATQDLGTGVDTSSVEQTGGDQQKSVSDTAAGADTIDFLTAQEEASEVGTGAEVLDLSFSTSRIDTGAGVDVGTLSAFPVPVDSATSSELISMVADLLAAEIGSVIEPSEIQALYVLNDAGAGLDIGSVVTGLVGVPVTAVIVRRGDGNEIVRNDPLQGSSLAGERITAIIVPRGVTAE